MTSAATRGEQVIWRVWRILSDSLRLQRIFLVDFARTLRGSLDFRDILRLFWGGGCGCVFGYDTGCFSGCIFGSVSVSALDSAKKNVSESLQNVQKVNEIWKVSKVCQSPAKSAQNFWNLIASVKLFHLFAPCIIAIDPYLYHNHIGWWHFEILFC